MSSGCHHSTPFLRAQPLPHRTDVVTEILHELVAKESASLPKCGGVTEMGDQLRSPPKTSLLFNALRSGGSLQFFCPELDYGNEVSVCARGLWADGGLEMKSTTRNGMACIQCRVVTCLTSCLAHGRRTAVSCWQARGFDGWAKNVLGLNGAMCCSQASC